MPKKIKNKTVKLSNKDLLFVLRYITNKYNASEAYRFTHPKANKSTAKVEGSKYLTKPNIKKFIEDHLALLKEKVETVQIHKKEDVLLELDRLGFSKPKGKPKFKDKIESLKLLGQHYELFKEKDSGDNNFIVRVIPVK